MHELCRSNPVTVKDSRHFWLHKAACGIGKIDNIRHSGAKCAPDESSWSRLERYRLDLLR